MNAHATHNAMSNSFEHSISVLMAFTQAINSVKSSLVYCFSLRFVMWRNVKRVAKYKRRLCNVYFACKLL